MITIRNKIDLLHETPALTMQENNAIVSLSAKHREGLELLKNCIKTQIGFTISTEGTFSARRRHLDALARAKGFLHQGYQQLCHHQAGELLAEELRATQQALNEITGEFTTDDLLGRIFANFCIGK